MSDFLGNFGPTRIYDSWEDIIRIWDVERHRDAVFTKKGWPAGDFICDSAGTRIIVQDGEARVLKPEEVLRFYGTTGWKLCASFDTLPRREKAIKEAIERFHAEMEEYNASLKAQADLGHEYRIIITLKDIRDMDHAWEVMQSLRLDGGNIESAVVEMAERRQYPQKKEGGE